MAHFLELHTTNGYRIPEARAFKLFGLASFDHEEQKLTSTQLGVPYRDWLYTHRMREDVVTISHSQAPGAALARARERLPTN